MTRITIIYDNEAYTEGLIADWGFACKVEAHGRTILFDTGAKGDILLANMEKLEIKPEEFDEVFISHDHWDHTGGLETFLKLNPTKAYLPGTCDKQFEGVKVERIAEPTQLHENIYSTGELEGIEQSLVIKLGDRTVVIAGCSHPGVKLILEAASQFGQPAELIGGLHGFDEFEILKTLDMVCPTHCTQQIEAIKALYPEKYLVGGAGRVIEVV